MIKYWNEEYYLSYLPWNEGKKHMDESVPVSKTVGEKGAVLTQTSNPRLGACCAGGACVRRGERWALRCEDGHSVGASRRGWASSGCIPARTGLWWVHPSHHRCWPPCLRWCCPQQGHAPGQRDADLPEDPFSYHWVKCKSTFWSRSMLKTCRWVDKCRDTWLLWQLVEIQAALAQARWAGLCCTQLPQGCVPMVCKAEVAGKKSKKEYQPRAVGSCAAGPLFVASSAIRQRQGFAGVQYKKFE